jgi:hypothetical protein
MAKFSFTPVNPGVGTPPPAADAATVEVSATVVSQVVTPPVTTVVPDPTKAPTTSLATVPSAAVSTERAPVSYGDDSDETGTNDIIIPRINIVQKVGDLSNIFTEGDIVFNKASVLLKSPKPEAKNLGKFLRVVLCGFRKDRFVEKTVGGVLGKIVDSEAQVLALGGTTNWNEAKATGRKLFQTLAEGLLLIERPEGIDDPSFSFSADGKEYALAAYSMKGTAYTNGAKVFRTARKIGWLANSVNAQKQLVTRGYPFGVWKLGSELKSFDGGNFAWAPLLQRDSETGPELRALAQSVLG